MWTTGLRSGTLYTVNKRPLDPRWSKNDLQVMLGWCANAMAMGWTEQRAFQTAEALVMRSKNEGILWPHNELNEDMGLLLCMTKVTQCHGETT